MSEMLYHSCYEVYTEFMKSLKQYHPGIIKRFEYCDSGSTLYLVIEFNDSNHTFNVVDILSVHLKFDTIFYKFKYMERIIEMEQIMKKEG